MRYISGRQIGRPGNRVGLPARNAGTASGRVPSTGGGRDGYASAYHGHEPDIDGRTAAIDVAGLMAHMRPESQPYRTDAYEDGPRITHPAPPPRRLSPGVAFGLMMGGMLSLMIIFAAGFLSAVMIFGEPSEGGDVTIRPAPAPQQETVSNPSQVIPQYPARESAASGGDAIVSPAEAGRDALPPPSPEVAQAEDARSRALANGGSASADSQTAAVSASERPQAGVPGAMATDRIIYPPRKPAPPMAASETPPPAAAEGVMLPPPGGNYSLQFGAFRNRNNAEALIREVAVAAQAGIVAETGSSGNALFFVRAGAFETRREALEAVQRLRDEAGVVTFVHANRISG